MNSLTAMPASAKPMQMPVLAKPTANEVAGFTVCLMPLFEACRPPLTAAQVDLYFGLLCDLPAEAVAASAVEIAATRQYPSWPMPGEIRAVAVRLVTPEANMSDGEAWQLCVKAVQRFGFDGERKGLATLPPVAAATLAAFGWKRFCDISERDQSTERAQFRDLFASVVGREKREAAMHPAVRAIAGKLAERLAIGQESVAIAGKIGKAV